MKNSFRRSLKKSVIWFKKKTSPLMYEPVTKTERDAIYICNTLIKDPKSDLLMHPSHDKYYINKYYIKSPQTGIFVTISTHNPEISIINHVYDYNVRLGHRALNNMIKTFLTEVENRRLKMENEYKENIQHSLHHIAKTLKERL